MKFGIFMVLKILTRTLYELENAYSNTSVTFLVFRKYIGNEDKKYKIPVLCHFLYL